MYTWFEGYQSIFIGGDVNVYSVVADTTLSASKDAISL